MYGHRGALAAGAEASSLPAAAGGGGGAASRTDASRGGLGQRWKRCEELGRGAHGTVYRAVLLDTGESIAVKQILTSVVGRSDLQSAENEIGIMRKLRHPNVVPLLGVQRVDDHLNIFLEYMDGGSLRRRLDRKGPMNEAQAASVTRKVLAGLSYLHSNGIAHRDIKGGNVLLSKTGAVKLADFGTSKPMDQDSVVSGLKGTPNWMAPEVIRNQLRQGGWQRADVWSVGCTVVEMLTGKMPWPNMPNPLSAMFQIVKGTPPPLGERKVSEEARSFIDACLAMEPLTRPTVEQLMEHPFLARPRSSRTPRSLLQPPSTPVLHANPYDESHLIVDADVGDGGLTARWRSRRRHSRSLMAPRQQQQHHQHQHQVDLPPGLSDWSDNLEQQQQILACSDRDTYHRRQDEAGGGGGGGAIEEGGGNGGGRRPPCRSRETAGTGQRGAYSQSMPEVIESRRGSGECPEEQQQRLYRRQRWTVERAVRNGGAPPPSPAAGGTGAGSVRGSPGVAAAALQQEILMARRGQEQQEQQQQQQQQQQQHRSTGTSMAEGDRSMTSGTGCNDDTDKDQTRAGLYATASSSPAATPTPTPPTPPRSRSKSGSPRTPHTHRGNHHQQQRFTPGVIADSGSPSYLSGGDGEERRPSLGFTAKLPHAAVAERCDGSSQTEPDQGQQQQQQQQQQGHHQQSPRSSTTVPRVSKTDRVGRNKAGSFDRSFTTSPITTLLRRQCSDSGGSGRSDATAAPSHGGGNDLNGSGSGGGDCAKKTVPIRRGSTTYNSPVEIFNLAKEEMLEQSGGREGGGGGGTAAAVAAVAAASSGDNWTRPDDPMTGEYLKLERQRGYKGSIDGSIQCRGDLRRWRSNSMPLQAMRTKSAGVLGALTKLPPLERNESGEGASLRGGGDGGIGGGGREAGDFLRSSAGLRNITSAPTIVGSYYPSSITVSSPADPARKDGAKVGEPANGRTPTSNSSGLSGGQYCFLGPADRVSDRAAGLSVSRGPAERSMEWKTRMARYASESSPREVGEVGVGRRAMRGRAASLAPISGPSATAATEAAAVAAAAAVTEAEGAEALTSLMINSLGGGGGLGSSAVFGFAGFSSSGGGADDDKSGFLACSTPGGGTNSTGALYSRTPPDGPFLASSCSSGSGSGVMHHHHHGVTDAGAGPRTGRGCDDGKVSVA